MKTITFTDEERRALIDSLNVAAASGAVVLPPLMYTRLLVLLEFADEPTCANPSHGEHCCRRAA